MNDERTAVGCSACGRAVWSTDVDAEGRCVLCTPPEDLAPNAPSNAPEAALDAPQAAEPADVAPEPAAEAPAQAEAPPEVEEGEALSGT